MINQKWPLCLCHTKSINTDISVPCERDQTLTIQGILGFGKLGGASASLAHLSVRPKHDGAIALPKSSCCHNHMLCHQW